MDAIIEFKDFSFKYNAQVEPTLKNINLKIYPGEKVLIVGASGSGKSTLTHCINGLVPFSYKGTISGEYTIKGQNPKKLGIFGLSKIVGTVLQDTDGQFIGLTVAEDIAFSLENDNVPQDKIIEKINEAASNVEITNLLTSSPASLSGGQKQRVSMAGVMVDDVDILLFDEPLANLDPKTGKSATALIDKLHNTQNKTVIIVEHRLEDALFKHVDRIIVVNEGEIVMDTAPNDVLASDILSKHGIREPLYISALKYAGCTLNPIDNLDNVDLLNITPYKNNVASWFNKIIPTSPSSNETNVLEIDNLSFSYGSASTLSNISFSIKEGEMISIVGKNGAGKSTLSALICGFIHPHEGAIRLNGEDIKDWSIKERGEKIALVMQNPNHMISKPMIFDEVALGLRARGVDESTIKEKVIETLKICGLYQFRNWPISALSFGQKKRVTIASILVMDPKILILDEPTAGQDYRHYTEIMDFLKELNTKYNITIIMITHDMHLMLEYTSRALVIADGKLIADDTPANILTNDEIIDKAYLKRTSLYDLALKCDINPSEFVNSFIYYETNNK